jgi:hypothetical protein
MVDQTNLLNHSSLINLDDSRILVLSEREVQHHVAYSCLYEFEDIISHLDAVDLYAPPEPFDRSIQVYKWVKRFTRSWRFANAVRPNPNAIRLNQDYDLFFVILANPEKVLNIDSIRNWRKRSKKAVCYLVEAWQTYIDQGWKPLLEFLKEFDHIFLGVHHAVETVAKITGRPCSYLPPGVDAIKFCPYPAVPERSVDISYIGRRSPITHQALLSLAEQGVYNYYYDTVMGDYFYVSNPSEHRTLLANQLKRSRYFVANRANVNQPEKTGGKQEIGYRFMEGVAAGTVMIGEPPTTEIFKTHFDWDNAVIKVPFDSPNIGEILQELDAQPQYLEEIRRNNVVNALLRHDWLYRWQEILATVGLEPTVAMLSRAAWLKCLAQNYGEEFSVSPFADATSLPDVQLNFPLNSALSSNGSQTVPQPNSKLTFSNHLL